jgi:arylsulfatase A-like enzyme
MNAMLHAGILLGLIAIHGGLGAQDVSAKNAAEHVVVVVWDGMRPDFVSPHYTPNLYTLVTNGVFFKHHHALYISSTEVNGTGLATGCHPSQSGIIANEDYRPELGWLGPQATEGLDNIRRGDLLTHGKYLLTPTLAELLQQAGISTMIAGTKPVVFLHDRARLREGKAAADSVLLYSGNTLPRSAKASLLKVNNNKPFPPAAIPNKERDTWTTKALINGLWEKEVPKFSLLWLSEPDATQHHAGPGSTNALAAIESSDTQLGEVIGVLKEKGVFEKTDLVVTADHGFSTIERSVEVVDALKRAKFKAYRRFDDPERGDILVVALGGSACFYVFDHDEVVTSRLAGFLQTTDFAGVIFSRIPLAGTFPLDAVRLNPTNVAPDLVLSYRWAVGRSDHGAPGLLVCEGAKGAGTHGSLSPYDMHANLVACGPDFKRGFVSDTPTGNIDVVPTVLHLLGVTAPTNLDGRVLREALKESGANVSEPRITTMQAASTNGLFSWRQYLKTIQIDNAVYFDEGNGEAGLR